MPADIFFQEYGPTPMLLFDANRTVLVGCITHEWPTARCWIGSDDASHPSLGPARY